MTARRDAILWSQGVLANPDGWVILDTETTGFARDDEIIEIGIMSADGRVLIEHRVRPAEKMEINPHAIQVHGISMGALRGSPTLSGIMPEIHRVVDGRRIIAYNVPFDARLLRQSLAANGLASLEATWECAMQQHKRFTGGKGGLKGGDHSAIGDCRATLDLIRRMAAEPL